MNPVHPILALAAAAWVSAAPAAAVATEAEGEAIEEVIAVERAFAEETRAHGFKLGFLAYVAPDGFVFASEPTPARPRLEAAPDDPPNGPTLSWWPQFAGVANSGDLGFTTGGANIPVRYFTVWQRQADGSWRWIYDGGPGLAEPLPGSADDPVARLAPATAAAGSPEQALSEIARLEAQLAVAAETDAVRARLDFLADEGIVAGSSTASYPGRDEQLAELGRQPDRLVLRPIGGVASRAGDLAFTWGEARWMADSGPRRAHYGRIWQKRVEGWRLVADMLVPVPEAPPA